MIKKCYSLKALMYHVIDFYVLTVKKGPVPWINLAGTTLSCEQHCVTNNNGVSDSINLHLAYEEKETIKVILRKLGNFKYSLYIKYYYCFSDNSCVHMLLFFCIQ